MQLGGIHHLTAVTAEAKRNHDFFTGVLGMRLVKKTVNQDDVSAYHLFYADGLAAPGTDLTFFDWPAPREVRGGRSIVRTGLRVADEASLRWWEKRLDALKVARKQVRTRDGRPCLDFEDFEGQRMSLVVDDPGTEAHPWDRSPVPAEHQIRGLGPITLSIARLEPTERLLTQVMGMKRVRSYLSEGETGSRIHVYEMGPGGPAAQLHLAVEPDLPPARPGAGGVHHVAFRVATDQEYDAWARRLVQEGVSSSGPVDRFYFRSLYFREPNGILFELATDGPGFASDEPLEHLGETLALPPFLEPRRREIEAQLKPI